MNITNRLTLISYLIYAAIYIIESAMLISASYLLPKKIRYYAAIPAMLILTAGIILICIFAVFNKSALIHGAYGNIQIQQTVSEIKNCAENGFIESKTIPSDHDNILLIFFKYGCKDCEAIHDELCQYIDEHGMDVYFVSTRSKTGQELLSEYPVHEIPAAVYIQVNDNGSKNTFKETLYTKTESGTMLNTEGLDFLRSLQKSHIKK